MGVAVGLVDRGVPVVWAAAVGTQSRAVLLRDGSVLFSVWNAPGSCTILHVRGPGQVERLGTVLRPIRDLTVSGDLLHMTLQTRERHGDAWMSRVVRQ
jgi:hypothetical protein